MRKKNSIRKRIHMKLNVNKLLKKIILIIFVVYFSITVYNQQKVLDNYKNNIAHVKKEIDDENEYKESLVALKENATSLEYIEKIAREKLNMYKPNEKVYIDIGG